MAYKIHNPDQIDTVPGNATVLGNSMIKALAQHTGRSIVNVPLARISTNQVQNLLASPRKLHPSPAPRPH